ncbi:MAG: hypothetical protein QNJ34_10480 [Xenococcaceae cyanobacterium MO_188.B29]|nr:hypothetical protein [Xenococcaceae cyanobacterium MO_188.B29]
MENINLIQITEQIPPSLNGIGHYAYKLAEQLQSNHNLSTSFLLIDKPEKAPIEYESRFNTYSLSQLQTSLETGLSDLIKLNYSSHNVVLIHFDRGIYDRFIDERNYKRYHLAFHLTKSLKKFKKLHPSTQIIIVFHEFLYPHIPRRIDYCLRPWQNYYMRSLIKLADILVCSNLVVEKQIKQLHPLAKIHKIPVFSNIREPKWEQVQDKQKGHWVLFGSTDNLIKNTLNFIQNLPIIKKSLPINKVNIIGGYPSHNIVKLVAQLKQLAINVDYYPDISAQEVSNFFADAQFCYQYYFNTPQADNPNLIFKSGVFANASAHGVIPVMGNESMEAALNCFGYPGFIYMKNNDFEINSQYEFNLWSKKIHAWYQQSCSLHQATNTFLQIINQNPTNTLVRDYTYVY